MLRHGIMVACILWTPIGFRRTCADHCKGPRIRLNPIVKTRMGHTFEANDQVECSGASEAHPVLWVEFLDCDVWMYAPVTPSGFLALQLPANHCSNIDCRVRETATDTCYRTHRVIIIVGVIRDGVEVVQQVSRPLVAHCPTQATTLARKAQHRDVA